MTGVGTTAESREINCYHYGAHELRRGKTVLTLGEKKKRDERIECRFGENQLLVGGGMQRFVGTKDNGRAQGKAGPED